MEEIQNKAQNSQNEKEFVKVDGRKNNARPKGSKNNKPCKHCGKRPLDDLQPRLKIDSDGNII